MQNNGTMNQWAIRRQARQEAASPLTYIGLYRGLITFIALLTLYRGTQMWYGYPTTQGEYADAGPFRMQIILYIIVALSGLALCLKPWPLLQKLGQSGLLLSIVFVFLLLSIILSQDVIASVRGAVAALALSLPMFLYYFEYGGVGMQKLLRTFVLAVVVINLLYTIVFPNYAFMTGSLAGDLRGMFGHKNGLGQSASLLFAVLLCTAARPNLPWRTRLVDIAGCVGAAALAIGAHSSTALLQMGIGFSTFIAVTALQYVKQKSMRHLVVATLGILLIWIILMAGSFAVSSFTSQVGKDMTFSGRTLIWATLWPHLFDYPVTGHGFAMLRNPSYISQFASELSWHVLSTHNTYLELALNLGIPGALAWIGFLLSRLFMKLTDVSDNREMMAVRRQEAVLIVMIAIGALTEAGEMLAPLPMWTFLAASLPMTAAVARTRHRRGWHRNVRTD